MQGIYDVKLVALSILVATLASYTALDLAGRVTVAQGRTAKFWLLGGACAMGTGIWSMHFIGMLAFRLPIPMSYDIPITLLSMVFAVIVSALALGLVSRARFATTHLLGGAVLMGIGICLMHYTGMSGMDVFPSIEYDPVLFSASVAIAIVASLAALWIAFTLRAGGSDRVLLARPAAALVMGFAITGMHYTGMAAARFSPDAYCMTGANVDNGWLAVLIALLTLGILTITLMLSLFDARLTSRTGKLAASLSRANAELQYLVTHDNLTKLPNRLLLEERINLAIHQAGRSGHSFALMFMDLDRFKSVNDSLGHHAGDRLLQGVAQRLRECLRAEDTIARVGGDEFVLVLTGLRNPQAAVAMAQKIIATMSPPFAIVPHELHMSPSIGISLFPGDGKTCHDLLLSADAAMYYAKKDGRNTYRFFAPEMNTFAHERLELENGLRRALDNNEFELYYQPKVDIKTGRIVAMEALVRWRHPDKGMIPPASFIPLAEETGLIIPLGEWVMETAARQNRKWQKAGMAALRVAVNLSAAQFRQRNLLEVVGRVLRKTGLDPRHLEIELTESTVMSNAEEAVQTLSKLSDMGVHVSIDDFGTGYSSLSYLKRFQLDKLKIDRSFVRDITSNQDDAAIVRAIVSLAHSLRINVIAEGVETAEQLAFLSALGCDQYQGYHCSPPVPPAQFEKLMGREKTPHAGFAPAFAAAT